MSIHNISTNIIEVGFSYRADILSHDAVWWRHVVCLEAVRVTGHDTLWHGAFQLDQRCLGSVVR